MSRAYSKRTRKSSRRRARVVEKTDVLSGRVAVALPVPMAEVIGGASAEIERLGGSAPSNLEQIRIKCSAALWAASAGT